MPGVISNGHEDNSVLIVNDEPDQLRLMRSLLKKAGYAVLTAGDGVEGFALAKRELPDLVISDVSMPEMDGLEFCRHVRADTELKTIPILLISALQKDTQTVVAGLRAGADDYLELPFDSTRLIAKVSRLLERSRQEANYRDLVEHATDIIFTLDLEERLTGINTAGAKFLGFGAEEVVGVPFSEAFKTDPVDPLRTIGQTQLEIRDNLHVRTKDYQGQERWLEIL